MEKKWFKRKMYGLGWYPISWQGWTVLGIYVLALIAAILNANILSVKSLSALYSFIPEVIFYTVILIVICFKTGESLKWQWGKK